MTEFSLYEAWRADLLRFASDQDGDKHLVARTDAGNPSSWVVEATKDGVSKQVSGGARGVWFEGLNLVSPPAAWYVAFADSFRVSTPDGQWLQFQGWRLTSYGDAISAVHLPDPPSFSLTKKHDYYELEDGSVPGTDSGGHVTTGRDPRPPGRLEGGRGPDPDRRGSAGEHVPRDEDPRQNHRRIPRPAGRKRGVAD